MCDRGVRFPFIFEQECDMYSIKAYEYIMSRVKTKEVNTEQNNINKNNLKGGNDQYVKY